MFCISLGGWSEISKSNLKGSHIKSDERILGESDFVSEILSQASENLKESMTSSDVVMILLR